MSGVPKHRSGKIADCEGRPVLRPATENNTENPPAAPQNGVRAQQLSKPMAKSTVKRPISKNLKETSPNKDVKEQFSKALAANEQPKAPSRTVSRNDPSPKFLRGGKTPKLNASLDSALKAPSLKGPNFSLTASCSSSGSSESSCSLAGSKKAALQRYEQKKSRIAVYGRSKSQSRPAKMVPDEAAVPPATEEAKKRCSWVTPQSDPIYVAFHDEEWGVPVHDDKKLFEFLILSSSLQELSWPAILSKRDTYREVFCGFDPVSVANFDEKKIKSLKSNSTVMLYEGKLRAIVDNARNFLKIVEEFGSFDNYCWSFINHKPICGGYRYPRQVPVKISKGEVISKDLVKRGFRYVGPTIMYSFMQAVGMTNDHLVSCFRHGICNQIGNEQQEAALRKVCIETKAVKGVESLVNDMRKAVVTEGTLDT